MGKMLKKKKKVFFPKSLNLYRFIRLIVGEDIADRRIAMAWHMDGKNFHEFRYGVYPVPRLEKLIELEKVLNVNRHLIFEVGSGVPAKKVFDLIRKKDLAGQKRLIFG